MIKRLPRSAGAIGAAVALAETARRARTHRVSAVEEEIFRRFNNTSDDLRIPAWIVMQAGSLPAAFVVSTELARLGRRRAAVAALLTGVGVWGGVKVAKNVMGRERPAGHLEDVVVRGRPQTGSGYPSGHAAVAMTIALIATQNEGPACRVGALLLVGAVGAARMYVGAHLPLDVAGGAAIGVLCGAAANAALMRDQRP